MRPLLLGLAEASLGSDEQRERGEAAIELGVDDYLGKPYQEAQLLDAIAPLVERHREAQRARRVS